MIHGQVVFTKKNLEVKTRIKQIENKRKHATSCIMNRVKGKKQKSFEDPLTKIILTSKTNEILKFNK